MVPTPDLVVLAEEEQERLWLKFKVDRPTNVVGEAFPDGISGSRKNIVVAGGHGGLWLVQLLVHTHVVPQSWNQLVVYDVVQRATAH